MGLRINTNVAALQAQRHLGKTSHALSRAMERLASGSRIVRAGDDAAGLAISEGLQSQVRGLRQAVRNANDSLGFLNTAEGALGELTNITQRLRELAIQAANGAIGSNERGFLNTEAQALLAEFERISVETEFNGTKLLDGTFQEIDLQVGTNKGNSISFTIGDGRPSSLGAIATATNDQNQFAAADFDGTLSINGHLIQFPTVDNPPVGYAQSAAEMAAGINASSGIHGVSATVVATEVVIGTFGGLDSNWDGELEAGDLVINGVDILGENIDSDSDLVDRIMAFSQTSGVTAHLNDGGEIVLTQVDGRNIQVEIAGASTTGNFGTYLTGGPGDEYLTNNYEAAVDVTRSGAITLQGAKEIEILGANQMGFALTANMIPLDGSTSIDNVDISSQGSAQDALAIVDNALTQLTSLRADLGAVQNRLEMVVSNLSITNENLSAAQSQIRDADMAVEVAELTRAQILQQAGVSVLGQANVSAQVALSLLQF